MLILAAQVAIQCYYSVNTNDGPGGNTVLLQCKNSVYTGDGPGGNTVLLPLHTKSVSGLPGRIRASAVGGGHRDSRVRGVGGWWPGQGGAGSSGGPGRGCGPTGRGTGPPPPGITVEFFDLLL